ncbi:diguanylate cyclase domain-containing protein [Cohnella candidum]|uniref:Diguanylate cyclase n=1 Tax=Cohnella candidum TaxID=2674991 RepID=A0A3G3JTD3_9BACL|nr:diguanylate cyclase [Cohnella candidum]AYQ71486.1 diguanylate cyclase [Cohnella candidum]
MWISLIANFTLITVFLFFYNQLCKGDAARALRNAESPYLIGSLHGACGILLMFFSVSVSPTTILDMRQIMVISSAFYGGFVSSFVTAAFVAFGRIAFFGGFNDSSLAASISIFVLATGSGWVMRYAGSYWRKWGYSLLIGMLLLSTTMYILIGSRSLSVMPVMLVTLGAGGSFTAALVAYFSMSIRLASQIRVSERKYRELNSLQESIFQSASGISIVVTDLNGFITRFNHGAELMLGYAEREMIGKRSISIFDPSELECRKNKYAAEFGGDIALIDVLLYSSQSDDFQDREWTYIRKDGSRLTVVLMISPVFLDGETIGYMSTATDVTERKRAEETLRQANEILHELSFMDGLTGISNRRHFDEVLSKEWGRAQRGSCDSPLSLLLLDIDYFKKYNDTYGHQMGDECLRKVASLLQAVVGRSTDLVARYGGEEFALILPDTDSAGAQKVGEKLRAAMEREAIPHAGSKVSGVVTLSIGAATFLPNAEDTPEQLIARADGALYEAKTTGRNRVLAS